MSLDYDKTLAATRRWVDRNTPKLHSAKLAAALDGAQTRRRRVQVAALVLALGVISAWLASILAHPVAGPMCPWVQPGDIVRYGVVHVVGFILAALLVARDRLLFQVLVRALWWSTLLASSVGMWTQSGTLPLLMPVMAVASAGALLMLEDERFTGRAADNDFPLAAHRTSVSLLMILAVADTEILLTAGLNHDEPTTLLYSLLDYGCAGAMVVAIWGLYRLRSWGLFATVGLNVAIAFLGLSGLLLYDRGFAYVVGVTAVLQLVLCLPLLRTLRSGPPSESRPGWNFAAWSRWIIGALLVAGAVATVRASDPQIVAARCAEQ